MSIRKRREKKTEVANVVLYVRVSTAEQAESDLSIPAQRQHLARFCQDNGYTIVDSYIEAGASGTDENRPAFKKMLGDVMAPSSNVDAVLVYHSSRFMRNATKSRVYKEMLGKRGVRVICMQHPVTDDPQGRMAEQFFEVIDQYESEVNGVRTSAAMAENARQGNFNGSTAPYGYKIEKVDIRAGLSRNKLAVNPAEVDNVREVFRVYCCGSGAKTTARELNRRGVRYRNDKLWSNDLVLKVVQEEAVVGTYHWGKIENRTKTIRPRSEWVAIPVEPIIEKELFDLAQHVRADRDPVRRPGRTSSSPLLLAGLVRCSRCGAAITLETSGKLNSAGEYEYRYYNCRSFLRTGKEACSGCRVPVELLDQAVLNHLGQKVFSLERCREFLHSFVEETGILRTKTAEQRRQLEHEVADLEKRIEKWENAYEVGESAFDVAAPAIRKLRAKRDELAEILAKIVPFKSPPPNLYSEPVIRRFQESMLDIFITARGSVAKNYLRMMVDKITVTNDVESTVVDIALRTDATVGMLAASASGADVINRQDQVLTTVLGWRPRRESNARPTV